MYLFIIWRVLGRELPLTVSHPTTTIPRYNPRASERAMIHTQLKKDISSAAVVGEFQWGQSDRPNHREQTSNHMLLPLALIH